VLYRFTDADPNATAGEYVATVTWGDGTTEDNVSNPTHVRVVADPSGGFDVVGSHTYLTATSPGTVDRPPLTFDVKVVDASASTTDATGAPVAVSGDVTLSGNALTLKGAGIEGTVSYVLDGGKAVTVHNLHSLRFVGSGSGNRLTVDLDPRTPLLPTAIRFDAADGATLTVNGSSASNPVMLSRPGQVTASPVGADPVNHGQAVIFTPNVAAVNLENAAAVGAAPGPDTADRGTAFAGLTPQERALQALYLDALGRAGSKGELDGWAARLPSGATSLTQEVVSGIEGSDEALDHLVKSWYLAYLGRQANGTEELGWTSLLRQGQSEEQVLSLILASPEFFSRAQALMSGETSASAQEKHVRALYELLLGRTAGEGEVDGWVISGLSAQGIALGILQSQELRMDQLEGDYSSLLHRPGAAADLSAASASGLDVRGVRFRFETAPEFFSNG
jgi:hypothetical protein